MVELELLAVVWALKKCRIFLQGLQHFKVVTDHRPLIPILNDYTLDAVENPRLQRLKEKTSLCNFTAVWKKGKNTSFLMPCHELLWKSQRLRTASLRSLWNTTSIAHPA